MKTTYTVQFPVEIEADNARQAARLALAKLARAIEDIEDIDATVTEHLSREMLLAGMAQPMTEVTV